jgi:2'-5' RNA ligase
VYSLNVPVPGAVERLAEEFRPALLGFETIRERHTLLCKRLGDAPPGGVPRLREQVRTALAGAPAFEARVSQIGVFEHPPLGEGPVVYLAVESPGLRRIHRRLLDEFPAVEEFEGDDYVPHVTLARGGDVAAARRFAEREIEPVMWTVNRLVLWDANYEEEVATFSLPA